jgi:hypothetical protein
MKLEELAENDELLEIGRKAVEDVLVDMRDSRLSIMGRNNGLIIRERDGSDSRIIRLGTEQALRIALKAIAAELERQHRDRLESFNDLIVP